MKSIGYKVLLKHFYESFIIILDISSSKKL